ncbi:MAG: phage holin family protein [Parcubacteria group bacterium]|nr:phage holin family protein [Parcubacteria group bacterium]
MLQRAILQTAGAFAGLWLASRFLENVSFTGSVLVLGQAALVLGVANAFLKPILNLLTLPVRILTLGLSSLLINVAFVWLLDIIFPELIIGSIIALLETTVVVWIFSTILSVAKK